jgi:FkbM family methyltransferase
MFFIQIGANDGKSWDPIYPFVIKYALPGIVLEPLPDVFQILVHNYKRYPCVIPVNAAIHKTEKTTEIYRVDPYYYRNCPSWAVGVSSMNEQHHKFFGIPEKYIKKETVKCMTFQELIDQFKIKHVDLIQIDTEGYDYEILKMINYKELKPKLIHFEHRIKKGVMTLEQLLEISDLLHKNDFELAIEESDAVAYKLELFF